MEICGQLRGPVIFTPKNDVSTRFTGGWMGSRAVLVLTLEKEYLAHVWN
jgi:hypothetical protein